MSAHELGSRLAIVLVTFACAAPAAAQDSPRLGLTMGYPASIGAIWHVSDRIAIRPELTLTQISTTSTSTVTTTFSANNSVVTTTNTTTQSMTDQWSVGVGVSGLVYLQQWDALRTYVSPRFQYTRGSSSSTISPPFNGTPAATEFTSNAYFFSGSFGAEYGLSNRFAVFGELGFGYTHQTTDNTFTAAGNSTGHTIGTRSGAGVIVYF